jgi:hypothetical protein
VNDSETNGNEDVTMDDSEEATDGQSEVRGVSNHLTKSLTLTKVGSSQNADVISDSTDQEATPEVISYLGRLFVNHFSCLHTKNTSVAHLLFGTDRQLSPLVVSMHQWL